MLRKTGLVGVLLAVFALVIPCGYIGKAMAVDDVDKVITIYFAGTGLEEKYWDPDQANNGCADFGDFKYYKGFESEELLASLYYARDVSAANHFHKFIDGIGTDGPNCHWRWDHMAVAKSGDWIKRIRQAEDFLVSTLPGDTNETAILNLVGFSRGAVLALLFADLVSTDPKEFARDGYWMDNKDATNPYRTKVKAINILAFDPVPGYTDLIGHDRLRYDSKKIYGQKRGRSPIVIMRHTCIP